VIRLFFASLILAAAGCASTSSTTALQTFNDVYNAAVAADDLAVQAGTAALNSGLITSAQAQSVQNITTTAMALLNAAQTAFTAGNQVAANQNVATATASLVSLSLCLTQKPLTTATFATCAAHIPAPVVTT
jgi:hypothetical protein